MKIFIYKKIIKYLKGCKGEMLKYIDKNHTIGFFFEFEKQRKRRFGGQRLQIFSGE